MQRKFFQESDSRLSLGLWHVFKEHSICSVESLLRFKAAKMDPMLYQDVWGRPSVSLCLAWDEGGQRLTVLQTRLRFSQSFIKACISGASSLRSRSCFLTTPPQSRCNRLISGRPRPVRVGGEDAGSYLVAFCMHLSPSDNYLKSIKPSPVFVFGFCVCVCVCVLETSLRPL